VAAATIGTGDDVFSNVKTGKIEAWLMASGATNTQKGIISMTAFSTNVTSSGAIDSINMYDDGTGAEDSTGALTVNVTVDYDGSTTTNDILTTEGITATLIK
jgi:hypothetical protein